MAFTKPKALLRKAKARTCEALWRILDNFHPEECAAFFKNAGYAST